MKASPWAFLGLPQAPVPEAESVDYGACRAELDGKRLVLRVAKTTPTKTGQFVTIWKRPHPDAEIALNGRPRIRSAQIAPARQLNARARFGGRSCGSRLL